MAYRVFFVVKWGSKKFDQLYIDEEETVSQLKGLLGELTGVDVKRQKLLAKGSILKVVSILNYYEFIQL